MLECENYVLGRDSLWHWYIRDRWMQMVGIWTFESTNRWNHHILRQGRRCTSEWGRNNHVQEGCPMFRQLETDKWPNHRSSFLLALHQENSHPGVGPNQWGRWRGERRLLWTVTKDRGWGAEARYDLGHRRLECKSGWATNCRGRHCRKVWYDREESDKGKRFVSFCALNNLAIASTMFPHKEIHRYKWTSPNGQYHNQIDHVAVRSNFKRSVQDVRAFGVLTVLLTTTLWLLRHCLS